MGSKKSILKLPNRLTLKGLALWASLFLFVIQLVIRKEVVIEWAGYRINLHSLWHFDGAPMTKRTCAYCGKALIKKYDMEHVFPKCLYPPSKKQSRVQRLTIPSCNECNNSWANDEAHFRNVLMLAGEPNDPSREIWEGSVLRSFDEVDGGKRVKDLFYLMKPIDTDEGIRYMIYPAEDDRVLRVVRKIVRGLCHYHQRSDCALREAIVQ